MPIERKVYKRPDGTHHITLPKSWVEEIEERTGKRVVAVKMEINGAITISPKLGPPDGGEDDKN